MRARRVVQVLVMCYPGEKTKIFEPHIARVFAPCVPQLLLGVNAKEEGLAHSAACMLWWRGRRSDACCLPARLPGARLEDPFGATHPWCYQIHPRRNGSPLPRCHEETPMSARRKAQRPASAS